jgi:hypothetical protein
MLGSRDEFLTHSTAPSVRCITPEFIRRNQIGVGPEGIAGQTRLKITRTDDAERTFWQAGDVRAVSAAQNGNRRPMLRGVHTRPVESAVQTQARPEIVGDVDVTAANRRADRRR